MRQHDDYNRHSKVTLAAEQVLSIYLGVSV
jgi:hypothetical protein